jgi:hypothetical protein
MASINEKKIENEEIMASIMKVAKTAASWHGARWHKIKATRMPWQQKQTAGGGIKRQ